MGCFVWGSKNSMGCFSGVTKTTWDVLPGWQIDTGCFVRVSKNGMGCFVPGCFVLHSSLSVATLWMEKNRGEQKNFHRFRQFSFISMTLK